MSNVIQFPAKHSSAGPCPDCGEVHKQILVCACGGDRFNVVAPGDLLCLQCDHLIEGLIVVEGTYEGGGDEEDNAG